MLRYSYGLLVCMKRKQQTLGMWGHPLGTQNWLEWLVKQGTPIVRPRLPTQLGTQSSWCFSSSRVVAI